MTKAKQPVKKPAPAKHADSGSRVVWLSLAAVLTLTLFSYLPSLNNDFTNWDDPGYVTQNPMLQNDHWTDYFTKDKFVQGHYIPLTMISFSMEYSQSKLNPKIYHRNNLILHLLNTALVFFLVFLLSGTWQGAAIAAAIFGVHPMHVESVAWVTERKDVLYTFFYLSALILYVHYLLNKKAIYFAGTLLLFVLSLFSKEQAVTLPLAMLLADYYFRRKLSLSVILEKVPFFILSIVIGIMTILASEYSNTIGTTMAFSLNSFFYASYGLITYLYKFIIPVNLAVYYPYPQMDGGVLPVIFYVAPVIVLAIIAWLFIKFRNNRSIVFGALFFLLTIAPLLQLLPVGPNIMAERYTYVPYIGLCFIVAQLVNYFMGKNILQGFSLNVQSNAVSKYKFSVLAISVISIFIFAYGGNARCKDWKNTESLWKSQIEVFPEDATAYNNLGFELKTQGRNAEAFPLLNKAIALKPDFEEAYVTRATLERMDGKNDLAFSDIQKAIKINPKDAGAYLERAILNCIAGKTDAGGADFNKSIQLNPNLAESYCSRGNYFDMTGNFNAAIDDYNKALSLKPELADAYLNRGTVLLRHNMPDKAISDFDYYLQLNPNSADAYLKRSNAWYMKKDYIKAQTDADQAQKLGLSIDPNYLKQLNGYRE